MLYHGDVPVYDLRTEGEEIQVLLDAGQVIFARDSGAHLDMVLGFRVVTTTTDKWFEVGVPVLASQPLTGNASAGWTWLNGFFAWNLEWSEDLVNWRVGKFVDSGSPVAQVINGEDCLIYWARSIHSVDSKTKSANLWAESTLAHGNILNGPFTALTINSIVRNLGGGTFTMPGDAAALQAALRAAGFAGATVVATSATLWRIDIPNISFTAYGTINKIYWPAYVVTSEMGSSTVDGRIFSGVYLNADGVICALPKQFARLGVTLLKL